MNQTYILNAREWISEPVMKARTHSEGDTVASALTDHSGKERGKTREGS